ncbi:MAG: hypothetical protein JJU45_15220 [Acidimicrobiia bacterium]|nr:hypothetical protein [Acidimicrobiia bacterium]
MARHRLAVTSTSFTVDTNLDTGHQGRLIDVQANNCTLTLAGRTGLPVPILDLDIINTSSTPCTIVAGGSAAAVHVVAGKVAQIPPNGRARAVSTGTNVWRLTGDLVNA